jgi:hypothetical protein
MSVRIRYSDEALLRMRERRITADEVESVMAAGETLRDYLDDRPHPSRLVLAWVAQRPLHVVYAVNAAEQEHIVITVYQPDPARWSPDFRTRVRR